MANEAGDNLATLLERNGILVADGGMGTTLFALGLENGDSSELWNVEFPDRIASVHQGYVEAGADIILTNPFGGSAPRLEHHGLRDRCAELNLAGASLARRVADESERSILVGGSIGPTGDLFAPLGVIDGDEGVAIYTEQAEALVEGGVDVLWVETMYAVEELTAAYMAASKFDLPIVTTMSFDSHGHTMMGVPPEALATWWSERDPQPAALGANCGIGPREALLALSEMLKSSPSAIAVAKSNCGAPALQGLDVTYPIGPDGMRVYAETAIDIGVRIIGACCGSHAEHVRAIREVVDGYNPGPTPGPDEIVARLASVDAAPVS